jgi:hypothetical protein
MCSKLFLGSAAAMAAMILIGSLTYRVDASVGPIPLNCNRACLENVINPGRCQRATRSWSLPGRQNTENDQRWMRYGL